MRILGYKVPFTSDPEPGTPVIGVDTMRPSAYQGQIDSDAWQDSIYDGGKFFGGFGPTQIQTLDYWTLRARSAQLFNENLYARGLLRRLVTNEINTGLTPEAMPDEDIVGIAEDPLLDWTESTETRFGLWASSPTVCDFKKAETFGSLQKAARMAALIEGDVLVILRNSQRTRLPMVQLVSGNKVQNPLGDFKLNRGHKISHGVETDRSGRVVAYWVRQDAGGSKRIAATGERSGRRISWLVFGTDQRLDDVRGQPILSLCMQSLKEIDRYRDSVQRKAVINSVLAMFIKKTDDKMGTLPVTGGAVRKDSATVTDSDGGTRTFNIAKQLPGLVMEELQTGEEPVGFNNNGTDSAFGEFEQAIISGISWANEIPPEVLTLAFSNNYSASQAAINEFKIYINRVWGEFGETFCGPIYNDWLISETLLGNVSAPGLLEAWRNPREYATFASWTSAAWYGSIKPSTDMLKQAKGSVILVGEGWSTNARESRITTGTKYSKNIKRLKRENEQKVEAMRPLAEFKAEFGEPVDANIDDTNPDTDDVVVLDDNGDPVAHLKEV